MGRVRGIGSALGRCNVTTFDVIVTGQGYYLITPSTKAGKAWARKHLSDGERTRVGNAIACDSGAQCRDIVAGMLRDGLAVEVNGRDMRPGHG
jgi:hypothetical protein